MREETRRLWASTELRVWPETYRLVSLPTDLAGEAATLAAKGGPFAALVLEGEEASLTLREDTWQASPLRGRERGVSRPLRAITFSLNLDHSICGYLAPAADRLAEAGVSIVPQCAYLKDHLLVHDCDLSRAVTVLEGLILDCRDRPGALPSS
jgi:hypothetical protein